MYYLTRFFILIFIFFMATASAVQRSFVNSDFESPPYNVIGQYCSYSSGNAYYCPDGPLVNPSATTGTTWLAENLHVIEMWMGGQVNRSSNFGEIMSHDSDFIYQNIDVVRGEVIYWSFDHAARKAGICWTYLRATPSDEVNLPETAELVIKNTDGSVTQTLARASSNTAGLWLTHTGSALVTIPTGTYRIGLRSVIPSAGSCGNFIDDVYIGFCSTGQILYKGACQTCPSGSTAPNIGDPGSCICNSSNSTYDPSSNTCTAAACPNNSVGSSPGVQGGCTCNTSGYVYNPGTNTCALTCPNNATGSNPGVQGGCTCSTGYSYDAGTNSCTKLSCPNNSSGNSPGQPGGCTCATGYTYDNVNNVCSPVSCPSNSTGNSPGTPGGCNCSSSTDHYDAPSNSCIPNNCPNNATGTPPSCKCTNGNYLTLTNTCITCPTVNGTGTGTNPGLPNGCGCQNGYYYDFTTNQCLLNSCPPPTVGVQPYCSCANGSSNTTTCIAGCINGNTWNSNTKQCTPVCRSLSASRRPI